MFKAIKQFVYLLQLENYNLQRYTKVIWKRPFIRSKFRQQIVWTPKLILVFSLAIFLHILVSYLAARPLAQDDVYLGLFPLAFVFAFLLLGFAHFVFLMMAVLILKPIDYAVKNFIVSQAKNKLRTLPNLHIIGITGSYGKTTMKEVLATILAEKYKVVKTPESVNTPVGISRLIIKHLNRSVEVFIAEMGAYQVGDIRGLCEIATPSIAVLTGINEAHLERFGSMENTIKAKFEIVENSRDSGLILLNEDNEPVKQSYQKFIGKRKAIFYNNAPPARLASESVVGRQPPLNLRGGGELQVPILGEYIWGTINACVIMARQLGLTDEQIRSGIAKIQPIPHRLQKIENPNGITVIDDSYNGNPDGVREAIKVLAKFAPRRKIYITPGLVEIGQQTAEVHRKIGEQLNPVADLVILIKNSVTPFIAEKLDSKKIIWFDTTVEAHNSLGNILKPGDVILFQNDWPDNYR